MAAVDQFDGRSGPERCQKWNNPMAVVIKIYSLEGPLYFAATELITKTISSDSNLDIVIDIEKVTVVDASGALLLLQLRTS